MDSIIEKIQEYLDYFGLPSFAFDSTVLQAIDLTMVWLEWWHDGSLVPIWFSLMLDLFIVTLILAWFVRFLRLLAQLLDGIPLIG